MTTATFAIRWSAAVLACGLSAVAVTPARAAPTVRVWSLRTSSVSQERLPFSISPDRDGAALERYSVVEVGGATLGEGTVCSHDSGCPAFWSTVPLTALQPAEGTHRVQVAAYDVAGRMGSATARVILDRTPPAPPTRVRASYDDYYGNAYVSFRAGVDPPLPDGTPGSRRHAAEVRHRLAGRSRWSAWEYVDDGGQGEQGPSPESSLDGRPGDLVELELRGYDAAGNRSRVTFARRRVREVRPGST